MLFSCPAIQNGQPFLSSRDQAQPGWTPVAWPQGLSYRTHAVRVLIAARAEWEAQQA